MTDSQLDPAVPPSAVVERLREALAGADDWLTVDTALRRSASEWHKDPVRPFVFAFGYMLVHDEERRAEEGPFAAAIVTQQGQFPPPLADIDQADVDAWRGAAEQLDDPIALSRLHDLLWERREGDRPDLHARAAVDAYVAISENPAWASIERVDCLTRALDLARSIADREREEHVVAAARRLIEDDLATEDVGPGVSLTLLGALARLDTPPPGLEELVVRAEKRYGDDPYNADSLTDLRAQLAPAQRERLRREQVGNWRTAAHARGGMVKAIHLERALELAKTHGLSDLVDEIRLELQEMKPEELDLKTVSTEVEIPADQVQSLIDSVVDEEGWERSLLRFGQVGPPGGEPEELDKQIEELRRSSPLQFLVTRVVISHDETSAIFQAHDDQSHQRLARAEQRAQSARFWSLFAVRILDAARERHGEPDREALAAFFTTDLIDEAIAERFARAIELFGAGQPDEAAHIIAPRIEAVLREMARRIGLPIIREPSGGKPGRVQSLGPILDQLKPAFGESGWHAYLENLLADPLGMNLRNVIAHGLRDQIDRLDAALLIQAACYLRLLQATDQRSGQGSA
jgi:hypothetical protein